MKIVFFTYQKKIVKATTAHICWTRYTYFAPSLYGAIEIQLWAQFLQIIFHTTPPETFKRVLYSTVVPS